MMEDSKGRYWIGTYNNGVDLYSPEWKKLDHFEFIPEEPSSLSNNLVYAIYQDSRGRIWIGTNKGLNRYLPGSNGFRRYLLDPSDTSSLSNNTVRDILEDSQGRLWFATMGGGVNRYHEETDDFSHRRVSDGLADNGVLSLLEGAEGRIWMATKYGLSVYHPGEDTFVNLQEDDGLLGMTFNDGKEKLASGELLLGTSQGVNRFSPGGYSRERTAPEVLITDCLIFNESRSWIPPVYERDQINLERRDSFVSFEFAATDYHNPGNTRYAYQLEGVDESWIYSGNRSFASYTNLQPGLYTFRVKASVGGDQWSSSPASLRVSVPAPPWRTPAAYTVYLLLLLGLGYLLIQWRAGLMLRQQVAELKETRSKLEEANRQLSILSIQDPLTGINNRRRLDDLLRVDWKQAGRSRIPLAALMIDIDFFKPYNDFHGHQQGDECLQKVADILVSNLERGSDYAARYGGEEFCVILHDTDLPDARLVAERLRQAVEEAAIPHGDSGISSVVTISIGVASWIPSEDQVMETLIAEADRCLYRAKAHGRNRTESTRLSGV